MAQPLHLFKSIKVGVEGINVGLHALLIPAIDIYFESEPFRLKAIILTPPEVSYSSSKMEAVVLLICMERSFCKQKFNYISIG